ncbi:MAG: universal stress protein [Nocardioides sp.]
MSTARPHDWDDPVVLPKVTSPQRILVPFDGSHHAERALAWAAHLALADAAEVVVVVAYEQPMTMRGRGATYVDEVRGALEAEALQLAAEAVDLLRGRELLARGVVIKGEVAHAILDTIDAEACSLVLIGRQGVSAEVGGISGAVDKFKDMLQGGIADKIVRHSPVPVVVVP